MTSTSMIRTPLTAAMTSSAITSRRKRGRLLARAIGTDEVTVRSFHHQGLDPVAEGMNVVARSPDGLVEAVEVPGQSFCLAVLWHPEQDLSGGQGLFDALVQATRKRAGALV